MQKPLIDIVGDRFVDSHGRHMILRGVNLGGDCKYPWPDGGTDRPTDFADHRSVSFVGRPFPIAEADSHLARIAGWGFNTLRLLVTWEAVEHAGPGKYDTVYLDYIADVARRAAAHGLFIFVDFHQDVWSRMTGGDGAPGWLFEKLGLDFNRFAAAGAAHVMQYRYDYADPAPRQEARYPMMSWTRNYRMPVNGIMWTAFFAGASLIPGWKVDGINVQHFLQHHYLGAMAAVAARLADNPAVIGFDTLNEPSPGWIGQTMSTPQLAATREAPIPVRPGPCWTPFAALKVASGMAVDLPVLGLNKDNQIEIVGSETVNSGGVSIWLSGQTDPFVEAGAWSGPGHEPRVLNEGFFCSIDPDAEAMRPFFHRVAGTIRSLRPDWLLFAEMNPYQFAHGRGFPADMPSRSVNASHWYDVEILWRKCFDRGADPAHLRDRYRAEIARLFNAGDPPGTLPRLIGEFGIPYDLNGGEAFARWAAGARGDAIWEGHAAALGLMYDALDSLLLSSTQWTYTASNRNDLRIGDGWNQEDLSIFSADQLDNGDGARGRSGFSRPYVERAQGRIAAMRFDSETCRFDAEIHVDPAITAPTVVFIPGAHFPEAIDVTIDPPSPWHFDLAIRRLRITATTPGRLRISIKPMILSDAANAGEEIAPA